MTLQSLQQEIEAAHKDLVATANLLIDILDKLRHSTDNLKKSDQLLRKLHKEISTMNR